MCGLLPLIFVTLCGENLIINKNCDVNWLSTSCDMSPLNYIWWGTVKDKFHSNYLETIHELKFEIEVVIVAIKSYTIENVLKNWNDRICYCEVSHMNEIVFYHWQQDWHITKFNEKYLFVLFLLQF